MRTPPFGPYPKWSTSKFFSFLRSALRSAYNRYPPKFEALNEAKRPYRGPDKRKKWEFQCNICGEWFNNSNISVDHKVPAGSLNNLNDLSGFVERLFCSKDGLQVLCTSCHAEKTAEEKLNRHG